MSLRLFLAILLDDEPRRRLAQEQQKLRAQADNVGWVKPENFHLTLQFLGETDPAQVPAIQNRMLEAAAAVAPFELQLVGLGKFPRGAVWAGLSAPPSLARLVEALGAPAIHPHITLGRARGRVRLELDPKIRLGSWRVQELVLMRSQLHPQGAIYTREFAAALGQPFTFSERPRR